MSSQNIKVFLDMDGVLADLLKGMHTRWELSYDVNTYPYPKNKYAMFPDFVNRVDGLTMENFCASISTHNFWANLELEPMATPLLNAVIGQVGLNNIYICSYPFAGPDTWSGKVEWVEKHFPELKPRLILCTSSKNLFANPNHVLVDDKNENVDEFILNGGKSFLVPQPWNREHVNAYSNWIPRFEQFLSGV